MKKLLLATFFICGILVANSQVYTPPNPTVYGENVNRLRPKLVLHIPRSSGFDLNTTDTTPQLRVVNDIVYVYLAGTWFEVGSSNQCPPTFAEIQGFLEENVNAQASLLAKQDVIPYGNNPDLIVDTFERYWNGYHQFPRLDSTIYNIFGIVQSTLSGSPYYTWLANSNMLLSRGNIVNLDSINYIGGQHFYNASTSGTKPTLNANGIVLSFGQNVNNLVGTTNIAYQLSIDGNGSLSARIKDAASGTYNAWQRPIYSVDLEHYLIDTGATVNGRLNALSLRVGDTNTPTTVFNVFSNNTSTLRGAALYQFNNGTNSSQLNMIKYRGTYSSPLTVQTGDVASNFMTWAYDGTQIVNIGSIRTNIVGTVSTGIVPSTMDFRTATAAGVLTTALNLDQAQKATFTGDVAIGGNTTTSGTFNKLYIPAHASNDTLDISSGKKLVVGNSLGFTATDGSSVNFRTGGSPLYPTDVGNGLSLESNKFVLGGTLYEDASIDGSNAYAPDAFSVSMFNVRNFGAVTGTTYGGTSPKTGYFGTMYATPSHSRLEVDYTPDTSNHSLNITSTVLATLGKAQMSTFRNDVSTTTKSMSIVLYDSLMALNDDVASTTLFKIQSDGKSFFTNTVMIADGTQGLNKVFTSDGTGNGSWQTLSSLVSGAALTKSDDTNVTLTLGGSPTNALLQNVSLVLGWTGTLADSRIASAATWNAKANSGTNTDITGITLNQTGLKIKGGSSNALTIKPNETLSTGRTLNIITSDADRTLTFTGNATVSGTHSGTSSGTNTGDQTISITGDVTASGGTGALSATVTKINGTSLAGLATGILKNTTSTGVPSIAVAGDFPTLNQNTTGTAAGLTTGRTITASSDIAWTVTFDGTANVSAAATIANSAITRAKMANWSAHTHWINNTGSAAAPVETPYWQEVNTTYDGSATWDGTAPTSGTITYDLFRDGMMVTLIIRGNYTNAGATNTTLTLTLPSHAWSPAAPTNRSSANQRQYSAFGGFSSSLTANLSTNNKAFLNLNGSSTPVITVVGNSTSANSFEVTVIYSTALPS